MIYSAYNQQQRKKTGMRDRILVLLLSIIAVLLSMLVALGFRAEQRSLPALTFSDTADGCDSIRMTTGLMETEIELTPEEQGRIFSLIWNYDYIDTTESSLNRLPATYGGPSLRIYFQSGSTCYRWTLSNSSVSLTTMISDIPLSTVYFVATPELIEQLYSTVGGLP